MATSATSPSPTSLTKTRTRTPTRPQTRTTVAAPPVHLPTQHLTVVRSPNLPLPLRRANTSPSQQTITRSTPRPLPIRIRTIDRIPLRVRRVRDRAREVMAMVDRGDPRPPIRRIPMVSILRSDSCLSTILPFWPVCPLAHPSSRA